MMTFMGFQGLPYWHGWVRVYGPTCYQWPRASWSQLGVNCCNYLFLGLLKIDHFELPGTYLFVVLTKNQKTGNEISLGHSACGSNMDILRDDLKRRTDKATWKLDGLDIDCHKHLDWIGYD